MTLLVAAALLIPSVFWDKGPETARVLKDADLHEIAVPQSQAAEWRSAQGLSVKPVDLANAERISAPALRFQRRRATATAAPWVDGNGWRFLRHPDGTFLYEAPGNGAVLAAAEAYAFGARAYIDTDEAGVKALGPLLTFLSSLDVPSLPRRVNIGFSDDGSPESGEFMNLLVRRNLLFRVVTAPDPKLDLNVTPWTPQYPKSDAGNPAMLEERVRANLTDEKRLLRIYGSEVVVGCLTGDAKHGELFLVNYGAGRGGVNGLHVRVRGDFKRAVLHDFNAPNEKPMDVEYTHEATEFTLESLGVVAVVDLDQ